MMTDVIVIIVIFVVVVFKTRDCIDTIVLILTALIIK
jgi:hypothetical protein